MTKLLEGVKVIDIGGEGRAGPYCSKLMADAGAEVVHAEPPGGDPLRLAGPFAAADRERALGAAFAFLNAGKRSVTLSRGSDAGEALLGELLSWAEILIEDRTGRRAEGGIINPMESLAKNPALVHVTLSNFGCSGPLRDVPATELTMQAAAGLMDLNGDAQREPLRYPGSLSQHWAGANAAQAALIAHWHSLLTGQGQHVDVSVQESLAATWWSLYADYQYTGVLAARGSGDLLETADGLLMASPVTSVSWAEYALVFEAEEVAVDDSYRPGGANAARGAAAIAERAATRPRAYWFDRCVEHHVPAGMMQSLEEIAQCPQLAARGFFAELATPWGGVRMPGTCFSVNGTVNHPAVRRVALAGEDNDEVYGRTLGHSGAELDQLRRGWVI